MPVSQEELDAKLEEYFSILDPLSQSILSEIESVKKSSPVWDSLSQKEKDKLVDSHFVPKEIRKRYAKDNAKKGFLEGAFPHRLIETGQGRHGPDGSVRDEFSDPFHWETQSQCETFYVMEPINNPLKTLSVQEQIERNNFVLATPPTSQKLPKKLTAPPTPSSGKKVSPSTPRASHHNPRSTYASSQRSTSKPSHISRDTPTLSTPDTHVSRDQNDNFEDDDEDTILLGEDEDVKKNDNQFDFLLNW